VGTASHPTLGIFEEYFNVPQPVFVTLNVAVPAVPGTWTLVGITERLGFVVTTENWTGGFDICISGLTTATDQFDAVHPNGNRIANCVVLK
jgi:hypothetical protein